MIAIVKLILIFPILLLRGGIIHLVWGWHAVPLGVRPLSLHEAVGLIFVVSLFKTIPTEEEDPLVDPWIMLLAQVSKVLAIWGATLLFAWIWHVLGTP